MNKFTKGFTLAEMLVVISIILILLAISLPQFKSIRDRQIINSASADVVSAIREASSKTRASLDSSTYGVYFDTNNSQLIIFKGTIYDPNDINNEVTPLLNPTEIQNVALLDNNDYFYFDRLTGFPNTYGEVTISLDSLTKTVIIGSTGTISIKK